MQNIVDNMQYIYYIAFRRLKMNVKKIKLARIAMNLSQEELAKEVNVTRQTIGLIEAGNYNPTLKLCVNISKALNKTLNDLFWEETNE